jgi:DNA repair protein RecO (recombination protein O)
VVRTEALLLKSIPFGETSRICRLFTRDRGVVPVIAKGVRRPRSRFGAALEPFRRLRVAYYEKSSREIQTLSQVELIEDHPEIVTSLERLDAAGAWLRFLRAVLPDGAPAEELYLVAIEALSSLDSTPVDLTRRWETYYRAAAALRLGIAPRLDGCSACERSLPNGDSLWFSIESGGLLCESCGQGSGDRRPIDSRQYALLVLFHHPEYSLVKGLELPTNNELRIHELIHDFIAYHADLRPMAIGHAGRR